MCVLPGFYLAENCTLLPTFRDNLSVRGSRKFSTKISYQISVIDLIYTFRSELYELTVIN